MSKILFSLIFLGCMVSCKDEISTPRPRAYPRVEYPKHELQEFSNGDCPFTFQFPKYAEVQMKADHPCWFDLFMPAFKARVHCSYLPVKDRADFDDMVKDTYTIAGKINERSNYMEESRIRNANGVGGLQLKFTGPAASPLHFFLTDTTQHFFKASLYFEAKVKPDSLAPIIEFVEEDVNKMIQSFEWKKSVGK
jgi:gliding motility-associated lipoprotein GldD